MAKRRGEKARKKKRFSDDEKGVEETSRLHPAARQTIFGIVCLAAMSILVLSYAGLGGVVGEYLYRSLDFLVGGGFFALPVLLTVLAAISFFTDKRANLYTVTSLGAGVFFLALLGFLDAIFDERAGGVIGALFNKPLVKLFGTWGAVVVLGTVLAVGGIMVFNFSFRREKKEEDETMDGNGRKENALQHDESEGSVPEFQKQPRLKEQDGRGEVAVKPTLDLEKFKPLAGSALSYALPPLDLLEKAKGTPLAGDVKAYANIIKRTLEHFGVPVEMGEVHVGPTVTRYTLKPAEGVKLSKITALQNDLALALAAHPIRIEAPIPGRSLVGIEIPNKAIALVRLRQLLESETFQKSPSPLTFPLGLDVSGAPIFADLTRMPHLLIAGATGSGKSVCIHTMVVSFLYRAYPNMLRFLVIDPKRVELSPYRSIPHLLAPPIVEGQKAINALKWAVKEMERRYETLAEIGARDIMAYNEKMIRKARNEEGPGLLPYLVIIIDELADLMAAHSREVEASVVRLAQMARAVGIHLVISTQRPSVEVLTGLIKANITSRIAFQVASQVDSRTILDSAGAEKLLGNGDMLFLSSEMGKPRRIQSCYISEKEVHRVVEYLEGVSNREEGADLVFEGRGTSVDGQDEGEFDDALFEEARQLVVETRKASASFLQRRLKVGYARAARLLDMLEEAGVIGPGEGAKPREVYIRQEDDVEA